MQQSKQKRILFVANDSTLTGGTSKSTIDLALELRNRFGHDIIFLLPNNGPITAELEKQHFPYKIAHYCSWIYDGNKRTNPIKNNLKLHLTTLVSIKLKKWIKQQRIDIIHSANSATYIGALLSTQNNIAHIWHIREFLQEDHNFNVINPSMFTQLFNRADAIICVSQAVYNKYKNTLATSKMRVIHDGVELPKNYTPDEKNATPKKYTALIAGTLAKNKGQLDAIKAIELLKKEGVTNLTLNIAGDGPNKHNLIRYVEKHHLEQQVHFLGFKKDLTDIRRNTNISLTCSKNEAFGRITVEAMLYQNLAVGSNIGGTTEIIQNKQTGILYKQGDISDLAKKIKWCMTNWTSCTQIIANARIYATEHFSIEKCATAVNEVYTNITTRKG